MNKSLYVFAMLSMFPVASPAADDLSEVIVSGYRKSVSASYAIREVPQSIRQDVECMVKVLQTEPHVSDVESGDSNSHGWMHHPFVKYRYQMKNGRYGTVWFDTGQSTDSKRTVFFIAVLPGLFSDKKRPPDWGTGEITKHWKLNCRVSAQVLFE